MQYVLYVCVGNVICQYIRCIIAVKAAAEKEATAKAAAEKEEATKANAHPDLRRFIEGIYDKANLPEAHFNKRYIITRCVDAFVANGFIDVQSVVDQCEYINLDDLSLKEARSLSNSS